MLEMREGLPFGSEPWAPHGEHLPPAPVVEGQVHQLEHLLVVFLRHVWLRDLQVEHVGRHTLLPDPGPLVCLLLVKLFLSQPVARRPRELQDLGVVREALDLEHRVVSVQGRDRVQRRPVRPLVRGQGQELILQHQRKEAVELIGVVRNGQRAGRHHAREETLKADLADEVHEIGRQAEGHAARVALEISCLHRLHRLALEDLRQLVARFQPWLAEAEAAGALAEAHRGESLELCLVERVREERVGRVVCREPLFEEEEVVHVVEDSVEVGAQEAGGNEASILAEVWLVGLADHGLEVVGVELAHMLRRDGGEASLLAFVATIKALAHPSDLEEERNVRVDPLLLQQEVVRFLEVLERQVILRELTQVHDELAGHAELHTSSQSLLVPLEDHVHQDLELCGTLLGADPCVVGGWAGGEWIALGVVAFEDNLPLVESTALHQRLEAVQVDSPLRQRLCLAQRVLSWDLDGPPIEVSEARAQLFQMCGLIPRVDGR